MMKRTVIFFVLLISLSSFSQPVFEHISSAQGLSSDKISDIIQDREGFYWIATAEGLNRFDGSNFKVFRYDKNDSATISNNTCFNLLESSNGDIWIATMRGISRYIKKKGIFRRYYFHHPGINDNMLNSALGLTEDGQGNIWVAALGLWKINAETENVTEYFFKENDSASISDESQCHWIYFDKKRNGLWLTTNHQLNFFDIATQKFYHSRYNPHQWPVFKCANKRPFFTIDHAGHIWLYDENEKKLYFIEPRTGNYSSVSISLPKQIASLFNDGAGNLVFSMELMQGILYNPATREADTLNYPTYGNAQRVNYKINRYFKDRKKNIWLCTFNGLFVARNTETKYRVFSTGDDTNGLSKSIQGMVMHDGSLYLGIKNCLYKYNFRKNNLKLVYDYPSPHGFRPLYNAGDSILWASVGDYLVLIDFKTMRIHTQVLMDSEPYFVTTDNQKRFWIGTWGGGVYLVGENGKILMHYTEANGLKNNYLVSGFNDGNKSIWFGFNGGHGFSRFDLLTKKFEDFPGQSGNNKPDEGRTITAILGDKAGNLWLGSYGEGLYYFNRHKNTYQNYRIQDGLSGDYINTLTLDDTGNLWVSTSGGIDIMNAKTRSIYHIDENMKFGSNDHVNNFLKAGSDSFLYFSLNKILFIQPRQYAEDYSSSTILLSSFKVLDKEYPEVSITSSVKLPFNKNFFSVGFSVLKTSPVIPANYKYKLDGFDEDWINAGNNGLANYTNVPPGKYRLLLNATDETGRWKKEPQSILITITPPFWKTWWFITLAIIAILSGLYFFYRYRITQVRKLYSLRSKISQDLHDEVASTLSGIRLYSELAKQQLQKKDSAQVEQSLNVISSNASEMKEDMSDIIWAINPANDSFGKLLKKLETYVKEITSAAGISFQVYINENISSGKLNMEQRRNIYLVCKEAINNAVKYSAAKKIELNVQTEDHTVAILIKDNGKGFDVSQAVDGNGLLNMKLRSEEIGGLLSIYSQLGYGTEIQMNIKI